MSNDALSLEDERVEENTRETLLGASDANIDFDSVCTMLQRLGFEERRSGGSHRIFYRNGVEEIINLQPKRGKGKPYQMRQIREILLKYRLHEDED